MRYRTSKKTGDLMSEEDYVNQVLDPAFERIRSYSHREHKGDDKKVVDRESLLDFIKAATGKATESQRNWFAKTDSYHKLKEDNLSREMSEDEKRRVHVREYPTSRTYYKKLTKRELISRRAELRREQDAIERELKRRKKSRRS